MICSILTYAKPDFVYIYMALGSDLTDGLPQAH